MQRYNSSLKEYKSGKYVLYQDHLDEVKKLKEEIQKLKKEYKKATTIDAYKHYFNHKNNDMYVDSR